MAAVREIPWLAHAILPLAVFPYLSSLPFNSCRHAGVSGSLAALPRAPAYSGRQSARSSRAAAAPAAGRNPAAGAGPGRSVQRTDRPPAAPSGAAAPMDANLRLWRAEGPVRRRAAGRGTGPGGRERAAAGLLGTGTALTASPAVFLAEAASLGGRLRSPAPPEVRGESSSAALSALRGAARCFTCPPEGDSARARSAARLQGVCSAEWLQHHAAGPALRSHAPLQVWGRVTGKLRCGRDLGVSGSAERELVLCPGGQGGQRRPAQCQQFYSQQEVTVPLCRDWWGCTSVLCSVLGSSPQQRHQDPAACLEMGNRAVRVWNSDLMGRAEISSHLLELGSTWRYAC